jgi:peptide/nickel transport system ATP-binding protein
LPQIQRLEEANGTSHADSPNVLLDISNLRVEFTKLRSALRRTRTTINAIDGVSFQVYQSEVLSVVGESGSGKTTVAKCILGLIVPTSGSIKYNGIEVTKLKGKELKDYRRSVQVIYQDPFESLSPRLDVYTTLSIPIRRLTGETDEARITEIVNRLLSEVRLDPKETIHKLPHQLSGGERQRINIARALAPNPKLLIADEPITMLDASQRLNILSLLTEVKAKRAFTMLLITHDLASAKIMSDRTAVMYSGKLVEIGPTHAMLSRPHHPYTELILNATPRLTETTQAAREALYAAGYTSGIEESQGKHSGCVFAPRCKYVTTICNETEPPLLAKSQSHLAACHNALNFEKPA